MFNKLCIIGVGLIGGSIAKTARLHNLATNIVGFGREEDLQNLQTAKQTGVIDEFYLDIAEAVTEADLVLLATPVASIANILKLLHPHWSSSTIYTDVGSTKGSVLAAAEAVFGYVPDNFVPAHPIAGGEQSGVLAAVDELFANKRLIITPTASTNTETLRKIQDFWQALGSAVSIMDAAHHDQILAATSHLPHILAFALVDMLGHKDEQSEIFKYAAGGFKDFTRIASSSPTMWTDICAANKPAILPLIAELQSELGKIYQMLEDDSRQQLFSTFSYANQARQRFLNQIETTMSKSITFHIQPGGKLHGETRVPGDKSMSHRSIMLGSLADGVTHVTGFLEAEDALATLQAFRDMGVEIEGPVNGCVTIHGVGKHGLKKPEGELYLGNSGTSMRLLSGLLAGQPFNCVLTGDKSLSGRPMKRVTDPLATMGAEIKTTENGTAPLHITGKAGQLQAIDYTMPIASAQVKSCLLLAGMYAQGETRVTEPAPTRDHTERMLAGFSYPVKREGSTAIISSEGSLTAMDIDVPSDISSAAFFLVGASIAPGSDVTLKHVGINPTRTGVIDILRLMGANIEVLNPREVGGEPVADLHVVYSPLKGIDIPEDLVPLAIDEFPVLFVAAACAEGQTRLSGAEELRVKESDRIQVMADGLLILGVDAQPTPDGMIINGGKPIGGGEVESHGDHRIAMSFSIAGLRANAPITVRDCANVNTSFPEFKDLVKNLGLALVCTEE
ncbi:MAG: bifunctional prephenate dehydrogenase/3-phosphoshikimate 1-carboxyvinyltransferase [Methylovulum sp.]|uniref:bifunctional prephenate dehydrogenase/3-phosphoshikimate 1-carboxyvinyltransferase n=1 Tax=Methylovulum sp. TaxID=1916980 RepID=UPI00260AC794|nr:bifunctional prephenate dehydrogenase/3-phosphoshikimate 1-carboxyvinyltransferase [Methylovulum sp.]MDD2724038.1 bifunctional prephenate dehydrogenase/3-phosphoshikimate 1-carboxyvinyltransferase [Methylovulum sp.]MDD5124189.1 bifunctional prephenate dehydrogenase/3-phosphoshikimate 1-carboxyvinyltransferase [Methylovulum sp.]